MDIRAKVQPSAAPSLLIATPVYSGLHPGFVRSLLVTHSLLPRYGVEVTWAYLAGDSLLSRVRNNLAAYSLTFPKISHILWIDGDLEWRAEDVLRLLQFDVDFVCGLYPRRGLPPPSAPPMERFAFQPLNTGTDEPPIDPGTGLLEVAAAGTGFMMTRRVVYERMAEAYPESKITVAGFMEKKHPAMMPFLFNHFPVEVKNGNLLSEDWGFCRRWRELGGQIWADPTIQLTHHGAHAYTGDPMSMFEPALEAAA